MSEKKLTIWNVAVNKKELQASKKPIALNLLVIDNIVISDKFNIMTKVLHFFYWL